jgi:hypothetical protein
MDAHHYRALGGACPGSGIISDVVVDRCPDPDLLSALADSVCAAEIVGRLLIRSNLNKIDRCAARSPGRFGSGSLRGWRGDG